MQHVSGPELDRVAVTDEARTPVDDHIELLLLLALPELVVRHDQQLSVVGFEGVDAEETRLRGRQVL